MSRQTRDTARTSILIWILFFCSMVAYAAEADCDAVIFVLDDGVNSRFIPYSSRVSGDVSYGREFTHGTAIACIIQRDCPSCEIVSIRLSESPGGEIRGQAIRGLVLVLSYMESHSDRKIVVNLSLGHEEPIAAEHALVRRICSRGGLIVAAAGNDNKSIPSYPAAYDEAIGVGTVVENRHGFYEKAQYSNYGSIDFVTEDKSAHSMSNWAPI